MAGTFSKSSRPTVAGSYFDFVIQSPAVVTPNIGKIVCVGFTHNWGPLKVPTLCTSFAQFLQLYQGNPSAPTSGYNAVLQAFEGDGDFGGASAVLAYRMGTATATVAAKATKNLQNTTPANAIALSAKYEGTLGNGLSVTTQVNAQNGAQDQLLVLQGTTILETYTYTGTSISSLVALINASSQWLTATLTIDGVRLSYVANQALTGGNDGTTLVTADYTQAQTDLAAQWFGVLVFENLTDPTITASMLSWIQGQNTAGKRFFFVTGGATNETNAAAITRATTTLNDPNVVTIAQGSVTDANLLDVNGNPTTLSPAQFAPRIAGTLAARGERYSMTFAKYPGITLNSGATSSDIANAKANGFLVLDRASDTAATVRIANGCTTWTNTTDPTRPVAIFSVTKFVATMQGLQIQLVQWADANVIGKQTVQNDTRTAVLAQINSMLRTRELSGSIQSGWSAFVDPNPPPSDSDNFIAFVIAAKFGRSVEQVYFTGTLG